MPHEFVTWSVVKPPPTFWGGTLRRLPVLLPLLGGLSYGAYYVSHNQSMVKESELLIALILAAIGATTVVAVFWHIIKQGLGNKVLPFNLDDTHLTTPKKKVPLSSLNKTAIMELIGKLELPYDQWRDQPRPETPFVVELPSTQGSITCFFATELYRQKVLRALKDYFTTNS